jgi:hypothetical protein
MDESERSQEPRADRASVLLTARLERFGGGPITTHRVRDLSASGMRVDQAAGLKVGATVLVTIGMLEAVSATVVRLGDGHAGLHFAEQIDVEQARARAAIAPKVATAPVVDPAAKGVSAGWMTDRRSPHRR